MSGLRFPAIEVEEGKFRKKYYYHGHILSPPHDLIPRLLSSGRSFVAIMGMMEGLKTEYSAGMPEKTGEKGEARKNVLWCDVGSSRFNRLHPLGLLAFLRRSY